MQLQVVVECDGFLSTDWVEMDLNDDVELSPSCLCYFKRGLLNHYIATIRVK